MLIRCLRIVRYCSNSSSINERMKVLCVAEKNDAARKISEFLSQARSQRREGLSKFNKIYDFNFNFRGQNVQIVFTSVSGHLLTHDFAGTFRKWQGCRPEQLFEAPVHKMCIENNENIKKTLEREVRTCSDLIIWTDCDREGENIGYEIIDVCRAIKPNLTIHRARFSDMTGASIMRAMYNLSVPDERVSKAVDVRSELDLRIGAAFTRLQTMRLQRIFPEDINALVSYGSCQIPTLGFVAERYREIENFLKSTFWKIKLNHRLNGKNIEFIWNRNRLFDKVCCETLLMRCKADGKFVVTNVQEKPKSKWRPQPMDTIELEKTGSRKLKLTAKTIMKTAEKLYSEGYISYPRTETNMFSKDMNLRSLVEMQTQHQDWGEFANRVLECGPNPRNGKKSDQAHPPIHPTKFTNTLQGNEKLVYELVTRHFLACVSKDALGSETIVNGTIGGEEFHASGLVILERNYLDVYIYEKWTGKEIHNYQIGDTFVPTYLDLNEGTTSPPSLLTEADLIALMEKHGIGTDATHAEHIQTIKDRGYIGETDNHYLLPGTLGMGLVEGYELMNLTLSQPQLRAALEADLKAICDGLKDPQVVLREQIEIYKQCYQVISQQVAKLDQAVGNRLGHDPQPHNDDPVLEIQAAINHNLFKCPKCKNNGMIIKQKKDNAGSFIGCLGFPACKNLIWLKNNIKEISSIDEKCQNCGGENHKIKLKFAQAYNLGMVDENPAYSRIEENTYISCLYCDGKLREILEIRTEDVKILGNIVGANSRPINPPLQQQPNLFNNPNSNNQQSRSYGSSTNSSNDSNRRNWFTNDDSNVQQSNLGNSFNSNNNQQSRGFGSSAGTGSTGSNNFSSHNESNRSNWFNNNNNNNSVNGSGSFSAGSGADANSKGKWWEEANKNKQILKNLPNVLCQCNQTALKLMCKKEGPNTNRPFYKCNNEQCKFFQWADVPLPQHIKLATSVGTLGASTSGNSGGNAGSSAGGGQRKCGICRQPGHNKKNCPNSRNM